MTKELINKKEIYFPSYSGSNDNLNSLLNKTSQIICNWFSNSEKYGPLPIDEGFKFLMPSENGNSPEDLFSEIEDLISNSFNPVHPGSLAHLDPPPLILSILVNTI